MKLLLILLSFLFTLEASSEHIATISKIDGKVRVLKSDAIRPSKAIISQKLYKDDLLITHKDAMATIALVDNSSITLSEKSKLRLQSLQALKQEEGKIFYNIETQGSKSLDIATSFATIGVKGTKFIINSDTNKNVALKTGLVSIEALSGEFELHRKKERELTEYERYILAYEKEYQEYKAKIEEEYIEFKKQFDLQPNRYVTFDNNVVKENAIDENIENDFKKFEQYQR